MPLGGKPMSFGARELKALTILPIPPEDGTLLHFLIQHNNAFMLT